MQCHDICELLSDYIDEVISSDEKKRVEEHVAKCPACAGELRDLQQTVRLLQSLGEVMPPSGFREELMNKLTMESETKIDTHLQTMPELKKKSRKILNLPPVWRFAAAAVIVLSLGTGVALGVFHNGIGDVAPESKIAVENKATQNNEAQNNEATNTDDREAMNQDSTDQPQELALRSTTESATGTIAPSLAEDTAQNKQVENETVEKSPGNQPVKTYKQVKMPDRSSQKAKAPEAAKQNQPENASPLTDGDTESAEQIIKSAQINMNVASFMNFESHMKDLMNQYGGMITGKRAPSEMEMGRIVLEIPEKEFGNVLAEVETRGSVTSEQISGRDRNSKDSLNETQLKSAGLSGMQDSIQKQIVLIESEDTSLSYIEINIVEAP